MTPPDRGRWPPYLMLAAFVVLLLSPTVAAAAGLVAAAIGTAVARLARERLARPAPVADSGSRRV